ncbi:MAG: hypothetical protein EZS28_056452 [Streblomastix strix]|uniref:Uncharacterized protein n=1 Tax=Streblomastix strix TaxID=222440 RepID=A0A5J4PKG9_9EUKA|nr:MAG: hypothetical protein EZS28_056452 [Streblomastix strix]
MTTITTIIIDMKETEMIEMINQIWEEAERGEEQFQVKVQEMDRIMMIGLQDYTAKLKGNKQDNLEYIVIDESERYRQCKQLQELQSICRVYEQPKKRFFAQRTVFLLTLTKKVVFLGQAQNQSIKKERHQSRIFKQLDNYSQHKTIKNN